MQYLTQASITSIQQPTYYYPQLLLTTTHLCRGFPSGWLQVPYVRAHEGGELLSHMSFHQSKRFCCLGAAFLEHQSLPQSMECLQTQPAMLKQLIIIKKHQMNTYTGTFVHYWLVCIIG